VKVTDQENKADKKGWEILPDGAIYNY